MDQMTLFPPPYRYIIDTSALLSQKHDRAYSRSVLKRFWGKTDEYIKNHIVVVCSEIDDEIRDPDIKKHFHSLYPTVLEIDYTTQDLVRKIVTENPKMIEFTQNGKGSSSGDAFLIATAMQYNLTVITQEHPTNPRKIPQICKKYGVKCISIIDFWGEENFGD